jgi:hypothetical protein
MTMQRILTFSPLLGLAPDAESENQQLDCYLVNVSDRVREATIEVRDRKARF